MKTGVFLWLGPLMLCAMVLGACQNDEKSPYEKLAGAICDCTATSNLVELNTLAQLAMQSKDSTATDDTNRLMESITREYDRVNGCLKPAATTFGNVKKQELGQFVATLTKTCPKLDSTLAVFATELITEQ
jgi:hypothetical protein